MMAGFTSALRDALLVADVGASEDAVRNAVTKQVRELDPAASIKTTGYFNHSWVPDMTLRWKDGPERHLFLRFNVRGSAVDDIAYIDDAFDPVFLDIGQPDLGLVAEMAKPGTDAPAVDLGGSRAMITGHEAFSVLGAATAANPDVRTATEQVIRGGRGFVTEPVAEEVVEVFEGVAQLLTPGELLHTDPESLRAMLDVLAAPLSRIARLDLEAQLRARWVQGGRDADAFPGHEDWELHDRSPDEIAQLVRALLEGPAEVPPARWKQIARAVSADELSASMRGSGPYVGGRVNDLVRAAEGHWSAKWAWVPELGSTDRDAREVNWSLGGTSLALSLSGRRAVFVDRGNRFNTLPKPDALPLLAPRLDSLDDPSVKGIDIVTAEESVSVHLRASATETLGERLGRLMDEEAEVRLTGRVEALQVKVRGSDDLLAINFRTGRAGCGSALRLDDFARAIAKFMIVAPDSEIQDLETLLRGEDADPRA